MYLNTWLSAYLYESFVSTSVREYIHIYLSTTTCWFAYNYSLFTHVYFYFRLVIHIYVHVDIQIDIYIWPSIHRYLCINTYIYKWACARSYAYMSTRRKHRKVNKYTHTQGPKIIHIHLLLHMHKDIRKFMHRHSRSIQRFSLITMRINIW